MGFRQWLNESVYYHGTSEENAASILQNGIDPKRYQSGMFQGFYLTPNLNYFTHSNYGAVLQFEIDDAQILNIASITDEDLDKMDSHWRSMSYGWKNSLITKLAQHRGFNGLRNGKEVILLNSKPIISVKPLEYSAHH